MITSIPNTQTRSFAGAPGQRESQHWLVGAEAEFDRDAAGHGHGHFVAQKDEVLLERATGAIQRREEAAAEGRMADESTRGTINRQRESNFKMVVKTKAGAFADTLDLKQFFSASWKISGIIHGMFWNISAIDGGRFDCLAVVRPRYVPHGGARTQRGRGGGQPCVERVGIVNEVGIVRGRGRICVGIGVGVVIGLLLGLVSMSKRSQQWGRTKRFEDTCFTFARSGC